jgi:hypothetical protein
MVTTSSPPKSEREAASRRRAVKGLPTLLLACLAVVVLLPATAYADQESEAAHLQEQANDLIEQDIGPLSQLFALETKVAEIDPASPNAADALPLLATMATLSDSLTANARSITALYHKAAAMDVSPELKVYLKMREEVWRLHLKERELKNDRTAKLRTLFGERGSLGDSERTKLTTDIDAITAQERPLITLIDEKERASAQYYDDKRLGRRQVDWGSIIADLIVDFWELLLFGLLVIGALALSLIAWILRRLNQGVTVVGEGLGRLFKARPSGHGFQLRGNPLIWAALVMLVIGTSMILVGVLASD